MAYTCKNKGRAFHSTKSLVFVFISLRLVNERLNVLFLTSSYVCSVMPVGDFQCDVTLYYVCIPVPRLVSFYESVVPALQAAFSERTWSGEAVQILLRRKIRESQLAMLKVFRQMLMKNCIQPLLECR